MSDVRLDPKQVFLDALERQSPEELESYLKEACGENSELRSRVEALLRAHGEAGSFLGGPSSEAATIDQPITEKPGTRIGPYKLLQQLGEGGMGVIYMAEQTEPVERRVALKIIRPGMDTRQVVARFEAERQALALMDHPNIARVFDAGTTESGRPFFAMELVKGLPITTYCDEHDLTVRERLELFVHVCHAVQHAHQKGIIHRDLKPSNVLVAEYDDRAAPKIIDFGVAKTIQQRLIEKTMFTQLGQVVGTLEYMSPEQAQLNQLDIDTRSDIYSLGVLLYELLTGETPFDRTRIRSAAFDEMLRIVREEEPPRPSMKLSTSASLPSIAARRHIEPKKLSTLVRGELDWIVMKALEKDRGRRYNTANGFANDVERYLKDEPVTAGPPSAAYRFKKFARRNRGLLLAASVIVAALLSNAVISTWQAVRATKAEHLAEQRLAAEEKAHEKTHQAEREALQRLFDSYLAQTTASRWSGRPGQRSDALLAVTKAMPLIKYLGLGADSRRALRNEAIGALMLVDLQPVKTWKGRPSGAAGVAFSADLDLFASPSESPGEILVRHTDRPTAEVVRLPTALEDPYIRFSPQSKYLLSGSHYESKAVQVFDVTTAKEVLALSNVHNELAVDFDPSGAWLAVGDQTGVIRFFDTSSFTEKRRLSIRSQVCSVKFCPQGRQLAIRGSDGALKVIDVATGKPTFEETLSYNIAPIAWRPDGSQLVVGDRKEIHAFDDLEQSGTHHIYRGHQSGVVKLEFHPYVKILASTSWDGTTRLWDATSGYQLLRVEGHFDRFSPDGRLLAFRQGLELGFWEVQTPEACRWLDRRDSYAVAVGSHGRLLAVGHRDGVRLWDLMRLQQVAFLPIGYTHDVAFHPADGSLVTGGNLGIHCWPIQVQASARGERIRLGPATPIDDSWRNTDFFEFSANGRTLVAQEARRDEVTVLRAEGESTRQITLAIGDAMTRNFNVALSPDGNWAVTSSPAQDTAVWSTRTGERVCDLPTRYARSRFSPDGRWLVTNSGPAIGFWEAGTWRLRHEIPFKADVGSGVAFTPDSRVVAVGLRGTGVRLFDVETGEPIALLEVAQRPPLFLDLAFTPDGALLTAAADLEGVCVWDLRTLRSRLAELDLDWDQPPIREDPARAAARPLEVQVDLGVFAPKAKPSSEES